MKKKNNKQKTRGNVAIVAAIILVPVVLIISASVELARLNSAQAKAQNILDAALLRPFTNEKQISDVEAIKLNIEESMTSSEAVNGLLLNSVNVASTSEGCRAEANYTIPSIFATLFGYGKMSGKVTSQISLGKKNLEIAFVLDNSGSMADGNRISALRSATINTIDRFTSWNSKFMSLKMGLVPFSSMVNVGSANKLSSFMDYNALSPAHNRGFSAPINRFDLFDHLGTPWTGCVQSITNGYDVTDEQATQGNPLSLFVPWFWPDEPDGENGNVYPNNYLVDVDGGETLDNIYDLKKYGINGTDKTAWTKPSIIPSYNYYSNYFVPQGPNFFCDSKELTPLSTDFTSLKTKASEMEPLGGTNLTEGLAWGWRILSPNAPFTEGLPYGAKNNKVLIFFTDGENAANSFNNLVTKSENTTFGYAVDGDFGSYSISNNNDLIASLDAKTAKVCENIKNQGIKIYTIGLDTKSQSAVDLLTACASTPSDSFFIKDESELAGVFDSIGTKVINLYISK